MGTYLTPDAVKEQLRGLRVEVASLKKGQRDQVTLESETQATMEAMQTQLGELRQSFAVLSDLVIGEIARVEGDRRARDATLDSRLTAAERALHSARTELIALRREKGTASFAPPPLPPLPAELALDVEASLNIDGDSSGGGGGGGGSGRHCATDDFWPATTAQQRGGQRTSGGGGGGAAAASPASPRAAADGCAGRFRTLEWRIGDIEAVVEAQAAALATLREQRAADLELTQRALAAGASQRAALRADVLAAGAAAAATEEALSARAARTEAAARECRAALEGVLRARGGSGGKKAASAAAAAAGGEGAREEGGGAPHVGG